jgi:hypothetical protein
VMLAIHRPQEYALALIRQLFQNHHPLPCRTCLFINSSSLSSPSAFHFTSWSRFVDFPFFSNISDFSIPPCCLDPISIHIFPFVLVVSKSFQDHRSKPSSFVLVSRSEWIKVEATQLVEFNSSGQCL